MHCRLEAEGTKQGASKRKQSSQKSPKHSNNEASGSPESFISGQHIYHTREKMRFDTTSGKWIAGEVHKHPEIATPQSQLVIKTLSASNINEPNQASISNNTLYESALRINGLNKQMDYDPSLLESIPRFFLASEKPREKQPEKPHKTKPAKSRFEQQLKDARARQEAIRGMTPTEFKLRISTATPKARSTVGLRPSSTRRPVALDLIGGQHAPVWHPSTHLTQNPTPRTIR